MLSTLRSLSIAGLVLAMTQGHAFADDVVASAADAGKTVSVHVGQTLRVDLVGAHGSGKYWRINGSLLPELTLSGRTTNGLDVPGADETTSYSFKTDQPGTLSFKASYLAPGAPIPATDDIAFTVDVLP
jgi:FtsP/CotA-like multicopper oxidase with cupredoxin domain